MISRSAYGGAVGVSAQPQRRVFVTPIASRVAVPRARQVACQGLFGLGLPEVAVIAGVAALIFGPSKLPELGKSLGKTVKSFQTAANEFSDELKAGMAEDSKKPAGDEPKKTEN